MKYPALHNKCKNLAFILLCTLFLVSFYTGCQNKENIDVSSGNSPDEVNITALKQDTDDYPSIDYYPQIAQVLDGNRDGEILGFLWDENNSRLQLKALYIINSSIQKAAKVSEPKEGYVITNAVLGGDWIIYTEKTGYKWCITAVNKANGKKLTVDQGDYFKEAGLDYPSLSVDRGNLVYNISSKEDKRILSKIILYNLSNNKRDILDITEGEENYFGAPSIYADSIVWHRGEWTADMNAEINCYEIKSGELQQIPNSKNAITPFIWGDYIVWNEYDYDHPETKNIVLYNLMTKTRRPLTNAEEGDKREFWGPTIAHGIVSWNTNFKSELEFYTAKMETNKIMNVYGEQVKVLDSWIIFRDREKGNGTCIISFSELFPALDLSGSSGELPITESVISLDKINQLEQLQTLTPPEAASVYFEALKQQRYDLVAKLLAENTAYDKEHYLEELKGIRNDKLSFALSKDYMIEGEVALVCRIDGLNKQTKIKKSRNLHMTRIDGIWKMDILAAQ